MPLKGGGGTACAGAMARVCLPSRRPPGIVTVTLSFQESVCAEVDGSSALETRGGGTGGPAGMVGAVGCAACVGAPGADCAAGLAAGPHAARARVSRDERRGRRASRMGTPFNGGRHVSSQRMAFIGTPR